MKVGRQQASLIFAALMNLDDQVTSATKIAQSISEAPAIITVISRDKIIDRGYETVAEALGALPGFFINSDYILPDAGVRGVSGELRGGSRLIKVMVNGHPVSFRSETTNWLNGALIPMDAIDRIEVIRGPGSALYGANAFLGVVNIITRGLIVLMVLRSAIKVIGLTGTLVRVCLPRQAIIWGHWTWF